MRCCRGLILAGIFLFIMASAAMAAGDACSGQTIVIKGAVGRAAEIEVENGVGDLVRSGNPATLKVEHTAGHLFVTPLARDPAELVIIDTRGRSHRLRHVFDQGVDEKIVIPDCDGGPHVAMEGDLAMSLMRDLVRGSMARGATEKRSDVVMFENGQVRLRSVLVQELPQVLGYAMVIENLADQLVVVPVQQITFPGLLAISSEKDLLAEGESGKMYMVVRR